MIRIKFLNPCAVQLLDLAQISWCQVNAGTKLPQVTCKENGVMVCKRVGSANRFTSHWKIILRSGPRTCPDRMKNHKVKNWNHAVFLRCNLCPRFFIGRSPGTASGKAFGCVIKSTGQQNWQPQIRPINVGRWAARWATFCRPAAPWTATSKIP